MKEEWRIFETKNPKLKDKFLCGFNDKKKTEARKSGMSGIGSGNRVLRSFSGFGPGFGFEMNVGFGFEETVGFGFGF